ncbi:hypothetical protein GILI108418_10230 [Gillisia limnaea]|uniref:Uncharacterized protein n=1 Tax=Gillisia limnaea (strain DSM 15749 / LMG 21470 / R-8282) TaxID=865937 RepID=H2BYQ0_GILLR|nr:hypothetical protein Gilli_0457 [Gillisia limnaea DSM 15749]
MLLKQLAAFFVSNPFAANKLVLKKKVKQKSISLKLAHQICKKSESWVKIQL